ncbi:MAG: AzlC family ABC transporter permease [Spirochaetota bacterium]|nr:AzlC family ABC transporter permease [Spirochaetota bacterium]
MKRSQTENSNTLPGFAHGLSDGLSIAIGYMPIALTFGLLAKNTGISLAHTVGMSLFVFAGASQFMALGLIGIGTGVVEIVFSTFIVNIRHLLMSMSLNEKTLPESRLKKGIYAFGITDEVFAVASTRDTDIDSRYLYGAALMAYLSWVLNSGIGYIVGSALPVSIQGGMGIALYAMFIGLLVPTVKKSVKALLLAVFAGVLNFLFSKIFPAGWAIVAATVGAVAAVELIDVLKGSPPAESPGNKMERDFSSRETKGSVEKEGGGEL